TPSRWRSRRSPPTCSRASRKTCWPDAGRATRPSGLRLRRPRSVSRRLRSSARDSCAGDDPMSEFFGPLNSEGRVPPRQQTRVAAFLISAHGALARQFAFALPLKLESAWQTELNAQFYRETE